MENNITGRHGQTVRCYIITNTHTLRLLRLTVSLCSLLYMREMWILWSETQTLVPWYGQAVKSIPQQYVDFRKAFPLLPALWALIFVRGLPPQGQTVAAKVMATGQGGGVHQDVVATVTWKFMLGDAGGRGLWLSRFECVRGVVHYCSQTVIWWIPLHLVQRIQVWIRGATRLQKNTPAIQPRCAFLFGLCLQIWLQKRSY